MKGAIIDVSTASGEVLDYLVAKAEGWINYPSDSIEQGSVWRMEPSKVPFGRVMGVRDFHPSTSWSQAGLIITSNRISIHFCTDLRDQNGKYVHAEMDTHLHHGYSKGHDEPLIAAMRCHVISKLGATALVPSELVKA